MRRTYSTHGRCQENPKGKHHLEDLVIDGSVILAWILRKQGVKRGFY